MAHKRVSNYRYSETFILYSLYPQYVRFPAIFFGWNRHEIYSLATQYFKDEIHERCICICTYLSFDTRYFPGLFLTVYLSFSVFSLSISALLYYTHLPYSVRTRFSISSFSIYHLLYITHILYNIHII